MPRGVYKHKKRGPSKTNISVLTEAFNGEDIAIFTTQQTYQRLTPVTIELGDIKKLCPGTTRVQVTIHMAGNGH